MIGTNGNGRSTSIPFDEDMCERYIFGELDEAQQELFETAYFNDDSFFNRYLAVKDELLDLYSRNELDTEKRVRIESHFGSTGPRRQRLAESNDFISAVTTIAGRRAPSPTPDPEIEPRRATFFESLKGYFSMPALATVAVLLVLVAAGLWIVSRPESPQLIADDPAPQPASNTAPSNPDVVSGIVPSERNTKTADKRPDELTPQTKDPDAPAVASQPEAADPSTTTPPVPSRSIDPAVAPPAVAPTPEQRVAEVVKPPEVKSETTGVRTETVTLSSASRSVTGRNTASIGTATQNVVIRMLFGGDAYESYSVRVTTLGGGTVWRASNLTIAGSARSLAVTVPAGSLTRKDYIVVLEGRSKDGRSETIREYYLHVDRH
jgi:hypothetical protein